MERWNELIAGFVLGNLTRDEHQELTRILAENPHLKARISRLKQTATLQGSQLKDQYSDAALLAQIKGTAGWADLSPADVLATERIKTGSDEIASHKISYHSTPLMSLEAGRHDVRYPEGVASPSHAAVLKWPQRGPMASYWQVLNGQWSHWKMLFWLTFAALIAVGADNWRLRRLIAASDVQPLHLESTHEALPK